MGDAAPAWVRVALRVLAALCGAFAAVSRLMPSWLRVEVDGGGGGGGGGAASLDGGPAGGDGAGGLGRGGKAPHRVEGQG